jgi:hypothetical protein
MTGRIPFEAFDAPRPGTPARDTRRAPVRAAADDRHHWGGTCVLTDRKDLTWPVDS